MKKLMKRMKNEKGMTLVELLAVLVILGIIAAIAIPMVTTNIQESRDKADVNEALNIISAAKLAYFQDGKGTYEIKSDGTNGLEGYIDIKVDKTVTVSYDDTNKQWTITGHPAVEVVNGKGQSSATEADLRAYLKEKDE